MEELSAEKFRKFTDILFDVLGKNDVDVNRLIEAKEAVLRNTEEYKGRSDEDLRAIAYSEVVAEMMEPVLTDTDAISRISQKIKQQDKSLWGKIKDFIKGIVEKLKAAYRDMEPDSAIARLTRQTVTNSEAVLDAFSEAAADAVLNYNLQEGQKNNAREGVQFMSRNVNGEQVVWIEDSGLTNKQLRDYQQIANYIASHVGEVYTIIESGSKVYLGEDLPSEYVHSKYTTYLLNSDKSTLKAKNRAIDGLGEMIEIATNRRWEQTRHPNSKDAAYGMYRYDSKFAFPVKDSEGNRIGVRAYDVELLIRNASDGKKYLYDIVNIKKNTANVLELQRMESRNGSVSAAAQSGASTETVAQSNAEVKGNFLKSSRDSDGNALTEAQQRYFADSQVRDEDGNLIPVYHRTDGDFTVFLRGKLGGATLSNAADAGLAATSLVGHWFSDHDLGDLIGKNVVKSYLNIQNPYETDLLSLAQEISGFSSNPEMMQEHFEDGQYNMVRKAAAEFTAWLRSEGYDGLKVTDQENGGVSYVVLDSRQAKLTTNQNPTGARDLRYSSRTASDSEYLNLAQNPEENREALSRMVENAAREAGYTIKAYHGTTNLQEKNSWNEKTRTWDTEYSRFTVFKRHDAEQVGHFFNSDIDNAGGYGSILYTVYIMLKKPLVIDCGGQNYASITYNGLEMDTYEWAKYAKQHRYDGVIFENISDGVGFDDLSRLTTDYVVFDSNRIKSAEPVTYDNQGNVIPLSQRFSVTNRDIRYSARNPQAQVEAENERLKSDVQSQIAEAVREYRRQQDVQSKAYRQMYERQMEEVKKSYQKQISTMESEYSADLAQIQDAFFQTVEAYEKGQFRNEHLEKVLKQAAETQGAQAKASEADNATWEKEFNRLLRAYETSGRNVERLKQTVENQRARAKAKVEAARVTEQRGKLYRAVNEINRRLLNPTKTLYVPDSLVPAVTKFMQGLTEAMESPKNSWNVQGALETLQGQYQKLTQMNEGVFTQEYNQGILDLLDNAINAVGGTDFNKLSASQIEDVYSAVRSVLTAIRNENKMFAANLNKTYAEAAAAVLREESGLPNRKPTTGAVQDKAEKFGWNQLKPVYAMMRMGSDTLLKQYNNLRAGEDKWQRTIAAARAYGLGIMEKYHYDQWNDSLMKLDTETGTVELSLEERMSLYAYARREQAFEHLTKGGFVLSDKNTRTVKNRFGIKTEQT